MYPLHNFSDLLAENDGEVGGTAGTPEFMEMELDPSHLLRGAYRGDVTKNSELSQDKSSRF